MISLTVPIYTVLQSSDTNEPNFYLECDMLDSMIDKVLSTRNKTRGTLKKHHFIVLYIPLLLTKRKRTTH